MSPPFGSWPPPSPPIASAVRNDSSVAGVSVKDALNNLLAAGSAPVTKVFGRIGDVVAALGDYTSSLVTNASVLTGATVTDALNRCNTLISGLSASLSTLNTSNVTNVSGVTGATTTTALNSLNTSVAANTATIAALNSTSIANASSVAGANVTAALNTLAAGGGATRDPIWDAPTTPSADDDEFTVDTLASGVWTMYSTAFSAVATRDGGIDMTVAPAAGHYRSSVIGSTLYVQLPNTSFFVMAKPFAGALSTKQWWMLGAGTPGNVASASTNNPLIGLQFFKRAAGLPDNANRAGVRTLQNPARLNTFGVVANSTVLDASSNTWGTNSGFEPEAFAVWLDHGGTTNNILGFSYKRSGSHVESALGSCPQFNAATDYVVIALGCDQGVPPSGGVNSCLFALHFLRRVPVAAGKWIAQP